MVHAFLNCYASSLSCHSFSNNSIAFHTNKKTHETLFGAFFVFYLFRFSLFFHFVIILNSVQLPKKICSFAGHIAFVWKKVSKKSTRSTNVQWNNLFSMNFFLLLLLFEEDGESDALQPTAQIQKSACTTQHKQKKIRKRIKLKRLAEKRLGHFLKSKIEPNRSLNYRFFSIRFLKATRKKKQKTQDSSLFFSIIRIFS